MSDSAAPLPSRPSLEQLHKQAKELLQQLRADPAGSGDVTLADAQFALARKHGFESWAKLKHHIEAMQDSPLAPYERMAANLVEAYRSGAPEAMQRVWNQSGHRRTWEAFRTYMQLDLGKRPDSSNAETDLAPDDARFLVAREHGFESWQALAEHVATLPAGATTLAPKPASLFVMDEQGAMEAAGSTRDWKAAIGLMRERRISGLQAQGQMTDALLERFSRLDHLTYLDLHGSSPLTDAGMRHLASLPRLRHLDLSGSAVTDRGLEVLRHLPELRTVALSQTGVTDAGMRSLAHCVHLERVDLSATRTGDGAIKALTGKPGLHHFRTGNDVSDAGLALLHEFPVFKAWQGGEISMALLAYEAQPNYLLLRGSFTDRGMTAVAGLDGLFALNLDSDRLAVTAAGLAPLVTLPNLGWLAFDAKEEAMPYIAMMPRLRFLMCQDTVAGDEGFVALSRSQSIEYIWGRRCHNLRRRGFTAMAAMPALRSLSVSCKNVDDVGLSALPRFPALRELMPMDVPDDGYRHVGRCEQLESLVLMYCRETTDIATGHVAGLSRLTNYFASYTRITDRTPEFLGQMPSLERVELSGCAGITNAGVAALAGLPRLREVTLTGLRHVTREGTAIFPARVRVNYST